MNRKVSALMTLALIFSLLFSGCKGDAPKSAESASIDLKKIYSELESKYYGKTLKDTYKDMFYVGTIYYDKETTEQEWDAKTVSTEFNALTANYHMKMTAIQNQRGTYNFKRGDDVVNFAQKNGMLMHGHNLIWYTECPKWMSEITSKKEALAVMKDYIFTVMKHYKGKVYSWDVVNEVISSKAINAGWRADQRPADQNEWYRLIGEDWVFYAFEYARQADPDAVLYLNETDEDKKFVINDIYELVSELKEKGLIDGIGLQFHVNTLTDIAALEAAITRFENMGLKISISEVDVIQGKVSSSAENKYPPEIELKHALYYAKLFSMIKRHADAIERVTFWGYNDEYSYQNTTTNPKGGAYPLMFSREHTKKLAYYAIIDPEGFLEKYGNLIK